MDVHLVERIKLVGQALIELQTDTTAPVSGDLHVDSVLPIEPNYWDFLDQVYLDLDGSHNSLEFCSGWGPLPGELGSIEGDWEDF